MQKLLSAETDWDIKQALLASKPNAKQEHRKPMHQANALQQKCSILRLERIR